MSNEVATLPEKKERKSVLIAMAERFDMDPKNFESTLKATVIPANTSNEQFAAFLLVAKEYNLNPLTKEIYAFPAKGGGIQPIVGIDGWVRIINENPQFDGATFDDHLDSNGNIVSITCTIFRKDRTNPIKVTEYLNECKGNTDPWKRWPIRMLRHKALIQCARYAFGFSGIIDPDEAERMQDVTPKNQDLKAAFTQNAQEKPKVIDQKLDPLATMLQAGEGKEEYNVTTGELFE